MHCFGWVCFFRVGGLGCGFVCFAVGFGGFLDFQVLLDVVVCVGVWFCGWVLGCVFVSMVLGGFVCWWVV